MLKHAAWLMALLLLVGCTSLPLHNAIRRNDRAEVRRLLEAGGDLRSKDWFNRETALEYAARRGDPETVRLLLEHGADPDEGSAMWLAVVLHHIDVARVLLRHGARFDGRMIRIARSNRDTEIVDLLVEEGKRRAGELAPTTAVIRSAEAPRPAIRSDVDFPTYRSPAEPDAFAIVVGIEEYSNLPKALFATRDATAVYKHFRALGIPERNIVRLTGDKAVRSSLVKYLNSWLPRNVKPTSRVYFYFSGHGAPDPETGAAYLLPWDGDANFLEDTAFPLKLLHKRLAGLEAREVVVALDACFSGAGGRSVLARGTRPLVTRVDLGVIPVEGLTLFTAAASNQITSTLESSGHGIFTYYFLKGLNGAAQDSEGRVTASSLYDYLRPLVQDEAHRQNREQTPTYSSASDLVIR